MQRKLPAHSRAFGVLLHAKQFSGSGIGMSKRDAYPVCTEMFEICSGYQMRGSSDYITLFCEVYFCEYL